MPLTNTTFNVTRLPDVILSRSYGLGGGSSHRAEGRTDEEVRAFPKQAWKRDLPSSSKVKKAVAAILKERCTQFTQSSDARYLGLVTLNHEWTFYTFHNVRLFDPSWEYLEGFVEQRIRLAAEAAGAPKAPPPNLVEVDFLVFDFLRAFRGEVLGYALVCKDVPESRGGAFTMSEAMDAFEVWWEYDVKKAAFHPRVPRVGEGYLKWRRERLNSKKKEDD
ncbi:hypothetical protein NMY22_g8169 [Coprinellus aureogranulatus]|nr:hypothetical protein NMY22_g8169 [Coprinellus aureogranulatus]